MPTLRTLFSLLIPLLMALSACSKPQQSKEAVEKGVLEYLKTRAGLDINSMDVQIGGVSFRQNEADVTVIFQAKGSKDPATAMTMKYVMEQKDGKWAVKGRSGANEHGGSMQNPAGGAMPPAGAMPPGHPPTPPAGGEGKK